MFNYFISTHLKTDLKFVLVTYVDEVLEAAFDERFEISSKIKFETITSGAASASSKL